MLDSIGSEVNLLEFQYGVIKDGRTNNCLSETCNNVPEHQEDMLVEQHHGCSLTSPNPLTGSIMVHVSRSWKEKIMHQTKLLQVRMEALLQTKLLGGGYSGSDSW